MIYFITNDEYHLNHYREKLYDNIEVLPDNEETFGDYCKYINENPNVYIGYDLETTGLDYHTSTILLVIIGDAENQFVLHSPFSITGKYLAYLKSVDKHLLGHNIKFDIGMTYAHHSILFKKVYDTMIAEQRTYMKLGIKAGLEDLYIRHLDIYPKEADKSIREEFINVNPKTFKIQPRHIYYGASDVSNLYKIKDIQQVKIDKYDLNFLLYNIEFPLISIIAKAEATGFDFDTEKWLEIYNKNVKDCFDIECKLDEEVRRLRDLVWGNNPEKRIFMSGGKWDNIRRHNTEYDVFNDDGTTNVLNLFGEPMSINTLIGSKAKKPIKIKKNTNNINYNSDTQIIEIFGRLEEPLLDANETLVIPTFNKRGKVDKSVNKYRTNEPAFNLYLSFLPESKMKPFIELLLEHRGLSKAISTYGKNIINSLNPVTGKLHTVFGQCFTATGRMSSGGGDKQPDKPNFQNIPSKADYAILMRNCFLAKKGHSIGTHDLSGAELIIMCSLSQDLKLLRIAKEDIHSYVAQGCWRLIYKYRAQSLIKQHEILRAQKGRDFVDSKMVAKINELIKLSVEFIVDSTKKSIRTAFKPMTFGTIYGMYANKAAKTLNIAKEEGQIVINFIRAEFPKVFAMVEEALNNATKQGYLILNNRTKSRAWFPTIIKIKQGKISEKDAFKMLTKEQSEARNIRIQGTQVDMIKEATVRLQEWIDDNGYSDEITILSWIHDEIVDSHPKYMDGKSKEWNQWCNILQQKLYYNNKEYDSFPEVKAQIMRDTCNLYLENVQMDVDYHVEDYWTK